MFTEIAKAVFLEAVSVSGPTARGEWRIAPNGCLVADMQVLNPTYSDWRGRSDGPEWLAEVMGPAQVVAYEELGVLTTGEARAAHALGFDWGTADEIADAATAFDMTPTEVELRQALEHAAGLSR
jgi:hypothetical protein